MMYPDERAAIILRVLELIHPKQHGELTVGELEEFARTQRYFDGVAPLSQGEVSTIPWLSETETRNFTNDYYNMTARLDLKHRDSVFHGWDVLMALIEVVQASEGLVVKGRAAEILRNVLEWAKKNKRPRNSAE